MVSVGDIFILSMAIANIFDDGFICGKLLLPIVLELEEEMSSISKYKAFGIRGPFIYSERALRGVGPTGMCHDPSMNLAVEDD